MEKLEIDEILYFYTDYINLVISYNNKINEYEKYKIKTPEKINAIMKNMNIGANFLVINSELMVVSKCFNESKAYWYKLFFVKSLYRMIYETFKLIDKYGASIFRDEENNLIDKDLMNSIKVFRKKYDLKKIGHIRNNVGSHYTEDFIENMSISMKIDMEQSLHMHYDFLKLIGEISNFVRKDILERKEFVKSFEDYFQYVEKGLTDYYKK